MALRGQVFGALRPIKSAGIPSSYLRLPYLLAKIRKLSDNVLYECSQPTSANNFIPNIQAGSFPEVNLRPSFQACLFCSIVTR